MGEEMPQGAGRMAAGRTRSPVEERSNVTRNIQASTQLGSTVKWLVGLAIVAGAGTATAQSADDYRGGWRTDDSDPHTYEFSIRGDRVRGVYCTRCSDATTLAFVDGTLGADGLTFVVTHVRADGSTAYP